MDSALEKDIVAQEETLTRATTALDVNALDRLYADDIMMTSVLGHAGCNKATIIDEARRGIAQRQAAADVGTPFETSYDKEDLKVVGQGDTAVSSYRFVVKIKGGSINVERKYRTTNVWMRRDGRWQVVAAHTAFVLDPKQAAMLAGEPA
jgi:ketosteroid isomerase-like protein